VTTAPLEAFTQTMDPLMVKNLTLCQQPLDWWRRALSSIQSIAAEANYEMF